MKILFIAPYVPSRIRVRPFQIIKELALRHEVYVLALGEGDNTETQCVQELSRMVNDFRIVPHPNIKGYAQALASLPTPVPMCAAFCKSSHMKQAVQYAMQGVKFDLVHIEHLRAAHFASSCGNLPVVFDAVDCLTGLFGQMARAKRNPIGKFVMMEEAWKLRRYEPRMLARFDRTVLTSESERDELTSMNPNLRIDVLPNGVDTDYFAPKNEVKIPHRIVFSGKMGFHPNAQAALWFAHNVFKSIREKYADAEFVIVGSDPPADVKQLAEIPGITVTGYVEDIRPYLALSCVAVVPMQVAVGIQNKVLEAMAMGIAVVATPIATRAFGRNCPGIIEAPDAEKTIKEVSRLFCDPESAAKIGEAGRKEVVSNFSWHSNVQTLEMIYNEAIISHNCL